VKWVDLTSVSSVSLFKISVFVSFVIFCKTGIGQQALKT
jgi:hypothetical protein